KNRTALRLIPKGEDRDPTAYSYAQIGEMAWQGAAALRRIGIAAGDRVILMSENRPEWGIAYFAILLAGATAVPLDRELSLTEVMNLARVSRAGALVLSRKVAERLAGEADLAVPVDDEADRDPTTVWSPAHPALGHWL